MLQINAVAGLVADYSDHFTKGPLFAAANIADTIQTDLDEGAQQVFVKYAGRYFGATRMAKAISGKT